MEPDPFRLAGRVALVTGGNGGLGLAIARGLAAAGARVWVTGRDERKNAAVASRDGLGALVCDVRDEAAVARTVGTVVESAGRLDVLVNNAGNYVAGPVLELTEDDWRAVLDTHLTGSFLCAKHAARAMVAQGSGKIINIGSIYALFGQPASVSYTTAKTGMVGLTRSLAVELAAHGVQVNALLPGWYDTELTRGARETEWGERIRHKTPAQRWGEPIDLVGPAVFLASSASDFVTGVALPVDGGYAVADRWLPE
ncbi:SDR family NAD(P)-dependent oxidoreductase [Georgenia subflava]|uniref:SDR family oxidoreductase n=1 Tax=Georgenia subflava TaxID=1622177 RepID=A0A6N7EG97_9MICO|nr:SDR family oxidoreductase [Georgenia subflava]MPV37149.1 SDR family oxidoreductase [Georgenia subflava]